MLGSEINFHLGEPAEREAGNHLNGTCRKMVDTGSERIALGISRKILNGGDTLSQPASECPQTGHSAHSTGSWLYPWLSLPCR